MSIQVQSNDLVKSFNKSILHSVRFFMFHTCKRKKTETFETTTSDILKHFSLNASGQNYMSKAFMLNENTALIFFAKQRKDGKNQSL